MYLPMLDALSAAFVHLTDEERARTRVLVPGAGLGRLAWEVIDRGFSCQANEYSLFMLIASNWILNESVTANEILLYPFVHSVSNARAHDGIVHPIAVPDVLPHRSYPHSPDFSVSAGDFVEVYSAEADIFDAVLTCFFLDTARNVVDYLETIRRVLKPGGIWINCGPTLWHHEGSDSNSIELALDDLKALAKRIGFTFLVRKSARGACLIE